MRATKVMLGLLRFFLQLPLWYFLMYSILKVSNVDRLVWFMFWVYVPLGFMLSIIDMVVEAEAKK